MSEQDILAFVEAYLDNWRKDAPDLRDVFHPEGTLLPPGNSEPVDVAGAQRIVEGTRKAIPDVSLEILHWAERDGHIFIEWEMKGTVRGKKVTWRGINRNRLRGSKSIEAVSYWDRQSLFDQVGATAEGADLTQTIEAGREVASPPRRKGSMRTTMIRGSCLCGGVRFEADEVPLITTCHCSKCRKSRGAAFSVTACVPASNFRFLQGEELIQMHQPSGGGYSSSFCRVCGSSAPWKVEERQLVLVPAGLLDDDPEVRPALHMFVGSKAPWWEITDDAPQFEEWVPGYGP